jgi:hypothetical protein
MELDSHDMIATTPEEEEAVVVDEGSPKPASNDFSQEEEEVPQCLSISGEDDDDAAAHEPTPASPNADDVVVNNDPEPPVPVPEAASPDTVTRTPFEIPEQGLITQAFKTTRRLLLSKQRDPRDLDLAMQRVEASAMEAPLEPYDALFREPVPEMANFVKYYGSLKDDEQGVDVLDVELRKRSVLYRKVQEILSSGVPPAIVHLLFVMGAKTFVVAFYAVSQGLRYDALLQRSIFQVRPNVGANVSDLFEDHLQTLLAKGCELLQLDPAFQASIHNDHVSYDELASLLAGC